MVGAVYRARGLATVYVVAGVLMALLPLGAVLDASLSWGERLAWYLPLLAVALFMVLRLARVAVVATEGSVVVRNPFRTVEIPWTEVERIAPGVGLLRKVAFHRRDGSVVPASALPTGGGGVDASTQRMIDELEERRRQQAGAT